MIPQQWTIAPLIVGTVVRDKSQSLLHRDFGVKLESGILAWLLRSGNERILVDTGACGRVATAEFYKRYSQTPEQTLETQLNRFNTSPDEIGIVINTHLHLDHCSGNVLFKRARFFVQEREMEYARNPVPIHKWAYHVDLSGITFELLDGDAEIAPGLQVILNPGHTPGSQAVLVLTTQGLYILAGDNIPFFENMRVPENEPFWPNAFYVDLREYYESLNRVKRLGGIILPGHDLLVLQKAVYP
jgi:glyoxylase-like metal-dependent hydrolase (beta-lactamase superfamily II)